VIKVRATVLLLSAVALCGIACASKSSALVVLLPDPEGTTVGRASVENSSGAVDLVSARDATRVRANERPSAVNTMSDAEVQQMFGEALAALPPPPRRFVLNFRFESDELTDQARALLPEILRVVRERPFANVVVTGHTDTMGTLPANYELGLKRASTVRNLLIAAGLDAAQVEVSSLGETDPLVPTADGTAEPRNRRVDIAVR
jgi:outer membrane protein OmpA-like peptidoglycan-associated protein